MAWRVQSKRAMPLSSLLRAVSRSLAVFVFAAITFCSTRAHAENRTPDSVLMRNGQVFRGTLELAEVDAAFFKMTLADGKVITIPSSEVVRIERVVPDDPERSVTISDDATHEPNETGEASVTFIAEDGVALEERDGTMRGDKWHTVCRGNCTVSLPIDASYRVGGGGIRTSNVFRLAGEDGDHIVIRTEAHSRAQFALGITLVSVMSFVALVGLSAAGSCPDYDDSCKSGAATGAVVAVAAALTGGLGIVLIAKNPSSKVTQKRDSYGSFLARATSPAQPEHVPASVAAWHPVAPSFAPAARTSTLFTIHF
jgi:hypothetical protein